MRKVSRALAGLSLAALAAAALAHAQTSPPDVAAAVLELRFMPVKSAQLAIWVERADGEFLQTVRLTEAVAYRGIGNRPGASLMNSGFRWPYGRRDGVLPLWAMRRASAPGARMFRRVIFQDRTAEGVASKTSNDQSVDDYFCLSFDNQRSTREALDAVSCATVFSSDKGRFITDADVAKGYAEPYQPTATDPGTMRALSLDSLYPPRRDATKCKDDGEFNCYDHEDVLAFASHAREVMPDIDAVTMATPVGGAEQQILFRVPPEWADGGYRACLEINVEGDYNDAFNDKLFPTPDKPMAGWDVYALTYGYPYRGQPSVLYCLDFELGGDQPRSYATDQPAGSAGTWDVNDPSFGQAHAMDGISDQPVEAPGTGADRLLHMMSGARIELDVRPGLSCRNDLPPSPVAALTVERFPGRLHAHEWARLRFNAAGDDLGVQRYDVRVSSDPIVDDTSFMAAMPAKGASIEAPELRVPTDAAGGQPVVVDFGGLVAETHYYVAVRAIDECARSGPIASTEITTPKREFATVTPCFVASAAYGSPLANEIGVLRRVRDRELLNSPAGRALVAAYYELGPALAAEVREHDWLRDVAGFALTPVVRLAGYLDR